MISGQWGTTPEASTLREEQVGIPASEATPLLDPGAAESVRRSPAAALIAWS